MARPGRKQCTTCGRFPDNMDEHMQRPDHQGTIRTFFNDRREGEPTRNVIHHVRSQHGWLGLTDDPEQMKKFHDDMHKPLQSAPPHGYGPPGHTH